MASNHRINGSCPMLSCPNERSFNEYMYNENEDEQIPIHIRDLDDDSYIFSQRNNWHNLADFDESDGVVGSSEPDEHLWMGHDYSREAKKVYQEYTALKKMIKLEDQHNQDNTLNPEQEPVEPIKRPKKKKKNLKNKSYQEAQGEASKNLKLKGYNISNLKNISYSVCNYVESSNFTTYSDLFKRFMGLNPRQEDNKNLRRRMYDVINVLSSAKVLEKRSIGIKKCQKRKNYEFAFANQSRELQRNKLSELQDQVLERELRIANKRKQLAELKKQKSAVEALMVRNSIKNAEVEAKICLPFHVYKGPVEQLKIVDCRHIKILTQIHVKKEQMDPMEVNGSIPQNIPNEKEQNRNIMKDIEAIQYIIKKNKRIKRKKSQKLQAQSEICKIQEEIAD